MRLMNIASGSSGNATYVGSDHTHILIDCGVSRKRITEGLKRLDLGLEDLTAILITHEHSDHISSLKLLEKTRPVPVYTAPGTAAAIEQQGYLNETEGTVQSIRKGEPFRIGDIEIYALPVHHDAADPVCFRLNCEGSGCAVVTDLGEYNQELLNSLQGLNALMIEANHDVRMLEAGPYPYPLKLRVAGPGGHLSNESAGQMICSLLNENTKYISLAHLSKQNNSPDLARLTVNTEVDAARIPFSSSDFRIDVADPRCGTEIYDF